MPGPAHHVDSGRLRVAMVGGGVDSMIGRFHRAAIERSDRCELVAGVFSVDPVANEATGREIGLPPDRVYPDIDSLLAGESRIDDGWGAVAVAVLTPNHLHVPHTERSLESGFHVICEKPLTTEGAEAERLTRLARERSLLVAVTHTYTAYEVVRELRERIARGEIGQVVSIQVEYPQDWLSVPSHAHGESASGSAAAGWRGDPRSSGGGAIVDIGTHALNLAEFTTGCRVRELLCCLSTAVPGRLVDDDANLLLRFDNGATGSIWVSQVAHGHVDDLRLRVVGRDGTMEWALAQGLRGTISRAGERPEHLVATATTASLAADPLPDSGDRFAPHVCAFTTMYDEVATEIAEGCPHADQDRPGTSLQLGDQGVRTVRLVEAAIQSSSKGGQWVEVRSS